MVFIDAQNLFYGARQFRRADDESYEVDALELRDELTSGRDLVRAYWFDSHPTE